ncbi:hypothetical protein L1987_86682 [Smallanthus sonchifolius]|uniref:Uncharacterized protein n=1 Tax=Smallanthus sonchifolius TaxID=185202 RepID=A0ACB8XZA2_9ASTR|nr:hypothetical protein L1987_86682 [Smallanthus sonchifolius]
MESQALKIFSEAAYCCLNEQRAQRPSIHKLIFALHQALELQVAREHLALAVDSTLTNYWKAKDLEHLKIGLDDIKFATENFDEKYYIGSGGTINTNKVAGTQVYLDPEYESTESQAQRPTMKVVIKELEKALNFQETHKDHLRISFDDIILATNNFDSGNFIARGGFGRVYKGEILRANGPTPIAVKRWEIDNGQGEREFLTELEILFEYKHENIIGLMGYCNENNEKILVYEYASNGSMDRHLEDVSFTWTDRLKISIDVAVGLDFLHGGGSTQAPVIHRDIKSANILLTALEFQEDIEIWEAKLPTDYKGIIQMSKTPSIYNNISNKDLYDMFSKGIILQEGKVCLSQSSNGEKNEMVSATTFSYENDRLHKWRCIKKSRFQRVSLSRYYCGSGAIYVEGVHFRAIDDATLKLSSLSKVNEKKCHMLPAKIVLYESSDTKCFNWKPLAESSFYKRKLLSLLPCHKGSGYD